jgi:hypothetical protein
MNPALLARYNWLFAACSLAALAVTAGCHKGPAMYQVHGKVTFENGPAPKAGVKVVNFVPAKDSTAEVRRAASGPIEPDGSFTMFTRTNGDGVNAGDYAVVFTITKGPMDMTSLIPVKYSDINSPPYKVTVDHNIDDLDYTIDVSGAGRK